MPFDTKLVSDGRLLLRRRTAISARTRPRGRRARWWAATASHAAAYEITGVTTFAMDLTSCEKLWTTPVNPDSFHRLWSIDGTLVELSDDGTELRSLVAPG